MEKSQAQMVVENPPEEAKRKSQTTQEGKHDLVWDCGSSLYDSFELNAFKRQLDSAILHSRTMSMPHLVHHRSPPPPPPPRPFPKKLPSNKLSRSIQKLFKSMFKFKQSSSSSSVLWLKQRSSHEQYYVVYDKTGALTTIPEGPEIDFGGFSPEINSLVVKRTASERFTTAASTVGISCASY